MTIDAHLHLWVKNPEKYPWSPIGGYIPEVEAPLSGFQKVMEKNAIDGAVLVQPTPYGWDNSYLFHCKNTEPKMFKAVVLVDPFSESAAEKLQQLIMLGADGLRINLHLKPLEEWENKHFFQLLENCVNLKVPICLQLTPGYLNLLQNLAVDYPTDYIIDHLGRPKAGSHPDDNHFKIFLALSKLKNVFIKLSGMNYFSEETAPYSDTWKLLETAKDHFGPDHCMWGSDYPFVEEHWSYAENLNLIRRKLNFTEDELNFILHKTAWSLWWKKRSKQK